MRAPSRTPARGLALPHLRRAALVTVALFSAAPAGCAPETEYGTALDEVTVCATGSTVDGIDVSVYQGTIDWPAVRASGRRFAFMRVANATTVDTTFERNWANSRSAGMIRGAYQYFQPDRDAMAQAETVVRNVGRLGDGDLPVVCDIETANGQSSATIVSRIRTWMAAVEAGTGKRPIIYTGPYFWMTSVGGSSAFASDTHLWIAHYGVRCPNVPTGWSTWTFWQTSSTGRIPGISGNVDTDVFNGTLEQLQALANSAPAAPVYAARYVAQSWPLASAGAVMLRPGQLQDAWIELRNSGTAPWDENTYFAATVPRDRRSPFAGGEWASPSRPARVSGMVMPGETFRFAFAFHAPATPGMYTEHFGLLQDGVGWFSDPGQGGPPDEQIEARLEVLREAPIDASAGDAAGEAAVDAAPVPDAVTVDEAAGEDAGEIVDAAADVAAIEDTLAPDVRADASPGDAASDARRDGGVREMPAGGCQCAAAPGARAQGVRGTVSFAGALSLVGARSWRRRRGARRALR